MNIIGLNKGLTKYNKKLKDGGVCLIRNGSLVAVILEERLSRTKQDSGFNNSLTAMLNNNGLRPKDIDVIAYSTCCENENSEFSIDIFNDVPVKYISVNHHVAHAYSVFSICPFDEAIVIVMDAGGNVFDSEDEKWWERSREQHSYFVANRNGIELLEKDFDAPFQAGYAEVYRAITHYIGWNSSRYAGKVMALSAYGKTTRFAGKHAFSLECEKLLSKFKNNPEDPVKMVDTLFKDLQIESIPPRAEGAAILDDHRDLACWIQTEIEESFLEKLNILINRTGIRNICFAGGLGYNCRLNGKASKHSSIDRFFVGTASGDQGQCIGNAFFALHKLSGNLKKYSSFTPYLGRNYNCYDLDKKIIDAGLEIVKNTDVILDTAKLIADGNIVAWYNGRSEFGPRALGNRSIIADPRLAAMKYRLNKIKAREPFMVFGPSVIAEFVDSYFNASPECKYMTHAVNVKLSVRKMIPAIVHADGTSRIHTVIKEENPVYYDLINAFYEITSIPMVLNTSFNRVGEPIVESPDDAIAAFLKMDIQYMMINESLVRKPNFQSRVYYPSEGGYFFYPGDDAVDEIIQMMAHNKPLSIYRRNNFKLNKEFVKWLHYGKKITTIRYKYGEIEIPETFEMPMYATQGFEKDSDSPEYVGNAEIYKYQFKRFSELDDMDAVNDGFQTLNELKATLFEIYGDIKENEYVTIYHIYLNPI